MRTITVVMKCRVLISCRNYFFDLKPSLCAQALFSQTGLNSDHASAGTPELKFNLCSKHCLLKQILHLKRNIMWMDSVQLSFESNRLESNSSIYSYSSVAVQQHKALVNSGDRFKHTWLGYTWLQKRIGRVACTTQHDHFKVESDL